MKIDEFLIDGLKVQVHDDVMSAGVLNQWIDFYKNRAQFSFNKLSHHKPGDTHFLQCQFDFKKSIEVFDMYTWMEKLLFDFNPECSLKHFHSSYVNVLLQGDQFTAHSDIYDLADNKFYIGCVWFGNPETPKYDCGFSFREKVVSYKFNRMIMFDGRLWHRPVAPLDSFLRVSYYVSFSNAFNYRLSAKDANKFNPWNRNIINYEKN